MSDPLSVECPVCEFLPGHQCWHMVSEGAAAPREEPHPARIKKAKEATDD